MSKLLAVLIALAFASTAAAQTAAPAASPQEKQQSVRSTTEAGSTGTTGAATAKQQQTERSKVEGNGQDDDRREEQGHQGREHASGQPGESSGSGGTARQQTGNVAASKDQPKQRPDLSTPEAQKAMQKAATP